ncbi:rhamnogalacturonan acetylesterase [Brachybacterium sp. NBEC-018]|uniref:rhamnogalacturonan acetylesterase n=1 Tax=Brachybacterium sp. NBEC-018 TaxID=2996004 RepID=UPI002174F839|nr:rhamnogalacturonan acetylesterase [Brachybacterium sp. NBEC-018]UVY84903.1 rhamnogalacturonan acetylesterase [Brachybacterium sp. NBEC-018]
MTYLLAGDSTVAACPPEEAPMSGWGAFLGEHVDAPVVNRAVGGGTTESCLRDVWPALLDGVADGDTVLLQFGHNDQKQPLTLGARGGYTRRLRRMVEAVHARGGRAVLCTSVERRRFREGRLVPSHGDYPDAVRDLAAELRVPLIDLQGFTAWWYEDLGEAASAGLFCHLAPGESARWPEGLRDDTHFREAGARRIAAFVGRGLRGIERRDGHLPAAGDPRAEPAIDRPGATEAAVGPTGPLMTTAPRTEHP